MKLTIDITGQKGLSNGYYGNDDQTVANPQTQYLAQPGQMVDGFFNPFLRDGFLAPAVATTQTMTTDQSLTKVLSSQIYDELNNNTYFGEYANQLFQLQSPENMSLLRVLNLSSNSVINDLEIYQINGVRKLFYIYNQLNNISMNFNYSTSSGGPSVNYLVVGGGGGGGNADGSSLRGSGGGGGGEVIEDTFVATIGLFSIVVGAGGLAANNGNDSYIGTPIFHVLVGGGGGGGGSSGSSGTYTGGGGGGGGGGIYENSALWLSTTNTITVGSGGTINSGSVGNQGGESSIGTIIAPGGGGGGGLSNAIGGKASGGDGANGGGSPSRPSGVFLMPGLSIPGWGNVGGFESNSSAGGGGGYSGIGGSGSTSGGTGAEGKTSTISGASAVYGSGGGGGAGTPGAGGTNAGGSNGNPTANHCGGGGGGYFGGGQNGGSGVVIVRFLTSSITVTNSTGGTITTDGSYTVITWTTNGTFNFTYNSVAYRTARGGGLGGRQIDASGASPVVTQAGGIGYTGGGGGGAYNDGGGAHVFLSGGNGYYDGGNGSLAPASGNYASGGGGAGAFAAGTNGSGGTGGNGGNGVVSTISGLSVTYGGGGGGGGIISGGTGGTGGGAHGIDSITGNAGTANLGGGGGGTTASHIGGAGGSGVVIISYPTGSISATGGTITAVGENTIHTFTTNGTFQVSSLGASSFQFGGVLLPNGAATPVVAQSDNVFSATSSTTIQSGILTTAASTETIVAFVFDWAGIEPLSAVWHGTTMTKVSGNGTVGTISYGWAVFYLSNPFVGADTVTATFSSASTNRLIVTMRVTGCNTTIPIGTISTNGEVLETSNSLTLQNQVAYCLPITLGVTGSNATISGVKGTQTVIKNGITSAGDYTSSRYTTDILDSLFQTGIATLPFQNNNNTWLTATANGAFSNTTNSPYNFMRIADNGFAYIFQDYHIHKIDGTTQTGGANGTVIQDVLVFPTFFQITDALDYRGNMYVCIQQNTLNQIAVASLNLNLTTPCGVYIWDRQTTVANTADFIPVQGVIAIKRIFVAPNGALRLMCLGSNKVVQMREFNGSQFVLIKELGFGAAPQYVDSLKTAGTRTFWLGTDGTFYGYSSQNVGDPEIVFRLGYVKAPSLIAPESNITAGVVVYGAAASSQATAGYRSDRQGFILTYTDSSPKVVRFFPFDIETIDNTNQLALAGNVYTPVLFLPQLGKINYVHVYHNTTTTSGSTVAGTLDIYLNQSTTPVDSVSITRNDLVHGYKYIPIGQAIDKNAVFGIQFKISWPTDQTISDLTTWLPRTIEVDYDPVTKLL